METDNKKELVALIEYLIHHNEHHNDELKELANSLKDLNNEAYLKVLKAIDLFNEGNKSLSSALEELNK